jgi:L-fuconolactonase
MKIDSHNHFWVYNELDYSWISDDLKLLKRNFVSEDILVELNKNQMDGCIAVQARQSLAETEWLLELADKSDFIKGVVGWVDLKTNSVESQLAKYSKNPKFVGVRHVVQDEQDENFVLSEAFLNGISLLSKYNLTYDILIFEHQLPSIIQLVTKFPNQKFVVDHIAKPKIREGLISPWKENIAKLATFSNVCCKLSGMLTEADWNSWKKDDFKAYLDVVFYCFGVDRLMYGSDWPVCQLAGSYQQTLSLITDYMCKYTDQQKASVLGENAFKFYLNNK